MDEPPGDFFDGSIDALIFPVGLFLLLSALAALLAAARTALHFAGSVGREDLSWASASKFAQQRASGWLIGAPGLSVSLLLLNTFVRVMAVVILVAAVTRYGQGNGLLLVVAPGVAFFVIPEALARLFARKHPVHTLSQLHLMLLIVQASAGPVVAAFANMNDRWKRAFGESRSAEDALAEVLERAEAETGKEVVKGIVNFGVLRVRDLMKRRDEIACISATADFGEMVGYVNQCGYSRVPVYRGSIDHIEGILYIKDLLPFFGAPKDFAWANIIRPGYFVTADKKVDALLKDFQEKRVHVAIVRDEGGQTAGLITLEDLIEVVIREINEQRDEVADHGFVRIDERTFVFDGKASIQDVFRLLDIEHPLLREPTEFESLEDFIVEINDELPAEGEELSYDQFTFVVEAVEQKRIKRVRVNVHAQA